MKECSIPIIDQIDGLEILKDNWYSMGEGTAYSEAERAFYKGYLLGLVFGWGIPIPFIYPVPSGGIRAEWDMEKSAVLYPEVLLELTLHQARLSCGDLDIVESTNLTDMNKIGIALATILKVEVK